MTEAVPLLAELALRRRSAHRLLTGNRPRLRRRMPRQREPKLIALKYFGRLKALLERAHALVEERVYPLARALALSNTRLRKDAEPGDINDEMGKVSQAFFSELPGENLNALARAIGVETSEFQKKQLERQLHAALGVEVPLFDKDVASRLADFSANNVALIKSVPQRYMGQVEETILRSLREGIRWEELAKELEERFDVATSSAQLIARDQTGKLFSELNEVRQTALGVERYVWRSVQDNRVRDEHAAREGRLYSWDDPPADGHPGFAINCRCFSEPDLSDVFESL